MNIDSVIVIYENYSLMQVRILFHRKPYYFKETLVWFSIWVRVTVSGNRIYVTRRSVEALWSLQENSHLLWLLIDSVDISMKRECRLEGQRAINMISDFPKSCDVRQYECNNKFYWNVTANANSSFDWCGILIIAMTRLTVARKYLWTTIPTLYSFEISTRGSNCCCNNITAIAVQIAFLFTIRKLKKCAVDNKPHTNANLWKHGISYDC